MKLLILWAGMFCCSFTPPGAIMLNQLGYYAAEEKIAAITGSPGQLPFFILEAHSQDTVFRGMLGDNRNSSNSSASTRPADFSAFGKKGLYYMAVPGYAHSPAFPVGMDVYQSLGIALIKGFYYQRASMALLPAYAGKWARAAGHPDSAVFIHPSAAGAGRPAGSKISSSRGWYDAGDYNKYTVNSGISTSTLLSAYEDFPDYFRLLKTGIPESRNQVPDILDEAIYNMRWMLSMQDPADGGVYHKCTNALFDKMIMPAAAVQPRFVVQKGTAAALDFAAVMAQGARIFKAFHKELPGLADSCRQASVKAWNWALANPRIIYDQTRMNEEFSPKVMTGAYGDTDFTDEFFWAAAELYASTSDERYYRYVQEGMNVEASVPSWGNVRMLGTYALLHKDVYLPAAAAHLVERLKINLLDFAGKLIGHPETTAFYAVMGQSAKDFIWGSNAVAANQSIVLIQAWLISGDKKFLQSSLTNLDYLLGRNATGYCFVTGFGTHSPMHPHHRPSIADGVPEPVPGLLVGGPNPGMQDGQPYALKEAETAYTDNDQAYACNEIAINWNAPMVYLVNAEEALQPVHKN